MPLLRISCPPEVTKRAVTFLEREAGAVQISVFPGASHLPPGDLITAEIPRRSIDDIVHLMPGQAPHTLREMHISIEASESLLPGHPDLDRDEDVIWSQVVRDIGRMGRLSWVNVLLIVLAGCIAALGLIQDELLLIVGAMALSPDYYMIAEASLSLVRRRPERALHAAWALFVSFTAAIVGAGVLAEVLARAHLVDPSNQASRQFTLFIVEPNALSLLVALIAGVAGALAVTLSDGRGVVGVLVSVTTIPAAANVGVALVARRWDHVVGALVQLTVNVGGLIAAGTITLWIRQRLTQRRIPRVLPRSTSTDTD
jgi:uncharacterized hydrophobic protein (TIGR00271 family)